MNFYKSHIGDYIKDVGHLVKRSRLSAPGTSAAWNPRSSSWPFPVTAEEQRLCDLGLPWRVVAVAPMPPAAGARRQLELDL